MGRRPVPVLFDMDGYNIRLRAKDLGLKPDVNNIAELAMHNSPIKIQRLLITKSFALSPKS